MEKTLKFFKEIAAGFFILILLLKVSDCLHNATSSHIITTLYNNAGFVGIIICIFEFLISCYNTIDAKLKEKMKLKHHMVARNLREQIKRSILNKSNKLSCATLGQLLIVFYNDEEIINLVINELKNRADSRIELESIISYLFLENEYDNNFAQFFIENPNYKSRFQGISRNISSDFVDKIYSETESVTEKFTVNDMLISLRHMCLPHNYIEKDKFVVVCRTLLDLISEKLKKLDFENDGKNISIFLICIPLLQKKISLAKIHNEQLNKKIAKIFDSSWTNKAIKKAYIKVINSLQDDAKSEYDCEEIAYCASLISTYFDKLLPHQKIKLYIAVKNFNNSITSAYHNYTDGKFILLLVCSSIFSGIKEQQDLFDEAMSLAYLCASGTKSLQSQITEELK